MMLFLLKKICQKHRFGPLWAIFAQGWPLCLELLKAQNVKQLRMSNRYPIISADENEKQLFEVILSSYNLIINYLYLNKNTTATKPYSNNRNETRCPQHLSSFAECQA